MSDISNALPRGTILQGPKNKYMIQRALGQGSFGITYLATTEMQVSGEIGSFKTTVQVAVKEFFMRELNGREGTEVTSSSQGRLFTDYKKKFQREAVNLSKLQHPHIVKVLESFEANGTAYYAMEYIDGGSLDDYILKGNGVQEDEAIKIAMQIGSALSYMHAQGMLHLDLKPSNIMRKESGDIVLIDFGLSKQYDSKGEPESSTKVGAGTPGYAPIEQANYREGKGFPVTMDVYALGATLFKMLTGVCPPEASDILNDGFPFYELQDKNVSESLSACVAKAMAPIKKDRMQTVSDFVASLENASARGDNGNLIETPEVLYETIQNILPHKMNTLDDDGTEAFIESEPGLQSASPSPKPTTKSFWPYVAAVVGVCIGLGGLFFRGCKGASEPVSDVDTLSTPEAPPASQTFEVGDVSFKMIRVDGGTFTMGATPEQDGDANDREKPAHQVTLSSYYIGETEVTQALWEAVMGSNPSLFKGANQPVEYVSWDECQTFISKLNSMTGKNFRLPTEAEWEFAARGGNKSQGYKYSGSNEINDVAWFWENSGDTRLSGDWDCDERKTNNCRTHDVKQKKSNELGLYDMSGNVCEWCSDWYGEDYYSSTPQSNPQGPSSGTERVHRGGDWNFTASRCRVSNRTSRAPEHGGYHLGLRLVL